MPFGELSRFPCIHALLAESESDDFIARVKIDKLVYHSWDEGRGFGPNT